jgi:glycine betaine/proline transport system ATP-binding protein
MPSTAAAPSAKLSCRNLWKIFGALPRLASLLDGDVAASRRRVQEAGGIVAVADVSFDVRAGEIFVIMGLSGSGKSTLVRCLSRLVEPSGGQILFDGQDLGRASGRELIKLRRRAMGMVFQSFGLMPHLSVMDNVAFPLRIQGVPREARQARARKMIGMVGLTGRERAFPHELSGGQQQRVGIARSLAADPELWFLDEPFSALDPLIRRQMQDEFLRLQRLLGKTIVFITHDILEAFRLADRIALMREGEIIQIGTPAEIALAPADDYVARFTEEVPIARVITVGDLIERAAAPETFFSAEAEAVPATARIEELIPRLATGRRLFRVTRDGGHPAGIVRADAVLDILARDRDRRQAS